MKSVILLALVALGASVPVVQKSPIVVSTPEKVVIVAENYPRAGFEVQNPSHLSYFGQQYGSEGIYQVAQYIAYQFHYAQQLGYSPAQVSQYLLEQGYPQYVAAYLAQLYEAGLTQPYFQSPYHIFNYYFQKGFTPEVQQYIAEKIARAYNLFRSYYAQYGSQAFDNEYPDIPYPIVQYIFQQGRYFSQSGVSYYAAQYAHENLQQALQYAQSALQFFASGNMPDQYVIQQLEQGIQYAQSAQAVYQSYGQYHQFYVPYHASQYYAQQAEQAYHYFFKALQYIQQKGQFNVPQHVVQQIYSAYFAALRAYQAYFPGQFNQSFYQGSYLKSPAYAQMGYYYKQVLQHIAAIQQFLQNQGVFSQASFISQYLNRAYQSYQSAFQLYQQRYYAQPIVNYSNQQLEQAFQYLYFAYEAAQHVAPQYVVEQLQYALHAAQNLQYAPYFAASYGSEAFHPYGSGYQFPSGYGYQNAGVMSMMQKFFNKYSQYGSYGPYSYGAYEPYGATSYQEGHYGPYSQFSYAYRPYSQGYGYYGPYSSSSAYQYGSYVPYSSKYGYDSYSFADPGYSSDMSQYGYYGPYSYESSSYPYGTYGQSYGYYGPYSSSQYGSNLGSAYSAPYSIASSYQYGPYSQEFGYSGPYSQGYGYYGPYSSSSASQYGSYGSYPYKFFGSYPFNSQGSFPHSYGSQYGSYNPLSFKEASQSYSFPYAYSGKYAQVAAAAAA